LKNRLIVAAICVPVFFIVLFFMPPYIFAAVVAIICAVSAYELLHAIGPKGNERIGIYATFSAAIIPIGVYFDLTALVFIAVFLVLMCLMFAEAIAAFKTPRQVKFNHILLALFGGALIPLMLSSLVSLRNMPEGRLMALLPVISAFITDAGAYFIGVLLGKHKVFPLVSPKKTVEGFIGGLVIGTFAMFVYGAVLVYSTMHIISFWALILYGLVGAFLTELGDLAFSLIKREYNFKDYGRILPGHGGMLDRFDSMVFTAPALYVLVSIIPVIAVR
jgi:phosphatidate cytidylyltransferase